LRSPAGRPRWRIESASDASLAEVATWRYDPPYDFYNDDGKPVRNPERFFAVSDENGRLLGSLYFEERERGVFYGLGMRPDLTGKGLGPAFMQAGVDFAKQRYAPKFLRLDVAEFNQRAIKVYERAGFQLGAKTFRWHTKRGTQQHREMRRDA